MLMLIIFSTPTEYWTVIQLLKKYIMNTDTTAVRITIC